MLAPVQHKTNSPQSDIAVNNNVVPKKTAVEDNEIVQKLEADKQSTTLGQSNNGNPNTGNNAAQTPPYNFTSLSVHANNTLPIQPKLTINTPGDQYEQEADAMADKVMRMPINDQPVFKPNQIPGSWLQRKCNHCEEEEMLQRKEDSSQPVQASSGISSYISSLSSKGSPLPDNAKSFFEPRFGYNFSNVKIHNDADAAQSSQSINALAYTVGNNIVFNKNQFSPELASGKKLLAHELTHVVQQHAGSGTLQRFTPANNDILQNDLQASKGLISGTGPSRSNYTAFSPQVHSRGIIMRQGPAAQQAPARMATVAEAAEFLEEMVHFIQSAREFVAAVLRAAPGRPVSSAQHTRAHTALNQQKLRDFLANARTTFAAQSTALESGDSAGTRLRTAFLNVIIKVREAAPEAIAISDAMSATERDAERLLNVQLVAELIEADPFTSAGMLGTASFGTAETAAGTSHEAFINSYLDDLIRTIPGQSLAPADRDQVLARIQAGLRRAFLTVGTGPSGALNLQAITNPTIVEKYLRVVGLLGAAMSSRPSQLNIITDSPPAYVLPPDPVPDVTQQLSRSTSIGTVDFSHVPPGELPYIRFGVLQVTNTVFDASSTNEFRNASWTVALQVRRGVNIVSVRYELFFDASKNVRVERIGEAAPRQVAPAFAQLAVADKKAQLIRDFGLVAIDDRPAAPAGPSTPARPAAIWTGAELDQVKAVYDLFSPHDRAALQGVTLVRDHHGPASVHGQTLAGLAHSDADATHDDPAPPLHPPPHIHYYDDAFDQNALVGVGAPGSSGPGADWVIAHEVGHMEISLASRQANAAIIAANQLNTQANAHIADLNARIPHPQHLIRMDYVNARTTSSNAIHALNAAVTATPAASPAQRAQLIQAAQAAVVVRNTARAALATAGLPATMVQEATRLDAAADALLAATISIGLAQDQIPTFTALAGTFGFTPFTDYARREGPPEWFAETYALFITDPARLSQMNRNIFLWFQAGMPMDIAWRPVP